jgi:DNA-binding NarL/FixJ family response regulator
VVGLSEQGRFIRPFLEAGTAMTGMLETLHRKGIGSNFIEIIQDALNKKKDKAHLTGVKQKAGQTPVLNGELSSTSNGISMREREIIRLLADGLRNKEIANLLFVAEGTVKKHVYNIFRKLNVKNRFELISNALQSGLIEKN